MTSVVLTCEDCGKPSTGDVWGADSYVSARRGFRVVCLCATCADTTTWWECNEDPTVCDCCYHDNARRAQASHGA